MSTGEAKGPVGEAAATAPEVIDVEVVEGPADAAAAKGAAPLPEKPDIFKASAEAPEKPADAAAAPAALEINASSSNASSSNASTLAIAALLLAGVAVAQPLWAPHLPGFAPKPVTVTVPLPEPMPAPAADPAIKAELKALAEKLASVEALAKLPVAAPGSAAPGSAETVAVMPPPSAPGPDPRVDALTAELAALKDQLAGLTQRQAAEAAKAAEAAAKAAAKPAAPLPGGLTPAVALAVGRLQSDITLGQPFVGSLKMLRDTAGGDEAIAAAADTLQPLAGAGVATLPVLRGRFAGLGSDIIRADHTGEGATWMDKVGGTLSTLVTVRRYGNDIHGDSVEAVTGRAEEAVAAGRLDQAVAELSALKGPAGDVAAPWLQAAKARLTADLAAKTIAERAFALLAAADKGGNAQ